MNALAEKDPESSDASSSEPLTSGTSVTTGSDPIISDGPDEPFPVEFALLGGSVVASLIGLIGFGIPYLLLAVYAAIFTMKQRRTGQTFRGSLIGIAFTICIVGCAAGLWFSSVKWLHRPIAAPWQRG